MDLNVPHPFISILVVICRNTSHHRHFLSSSPFFLYPRIHCFRTCAFRPAHPSCSFTSPFKTTPSSCLWTQFTHSDYGVWETVLSTCYVTCLTPSPINASDVVLLVTFTLSSWRLFHLLTVYAQNGLKDSAIPFVCCYAPPTLLSLFFSLLSLSITWRFFSISSSECPIATAFRANGNACSAIAVLVTRKRSTKGYATLQSARTATAAVQRTLGEGRSTTCSSLRCKCYREQGEAAPTRTMRSGGPIYV